MQVLSKIMSEDLSDAHHHHLTDHRNLFLASSALSLLTWTSSLLVYSKLSQKDQQNEVDEVSTAYHHFKSKSNQQKVSKLSSLISQLVRILKHILTRKDVFYIAGIAGSLILRTMCDLWMIKNLTQVEASIIGGDFKRLKLNILEFLYASPILTVLNNGLKYCINRLQMSLRFKLSSYLNEQYTNNLKYYHLTSMNILPNIDQILTNDIERFSTTLVDVYSNLAKPFFDVVVYIQRLSVTYTGLRTPAAMLSYLIIAGTVLTGIRRPIAKMVMQESQYEGELRFVHSRMIANCEEIAFLNGHSREYVTLNSSLERLRKHVAKMNIFKFNIDCLDNMITKYFAQICGYLALSIPFMSDRYAQDNHNSRLETYYKSGRIMLNMSQSIGRLVTAGRDINKLAAYTQRVNDLFDKITDENSVGNCLQESTSPKSGRKIVPFSGKLTFCESGNPFIELKDVPLVTPKGELLVESISFRIFFGEHLLITGPNGAGKSSLFRTIAELWPLFGGELIKPRNTTIFYIPQKPYLALGTLRDQLIYPQTHQQMLQSNKNDNDLMKICEIVGLEYLVERESFDSIQDWNEILSGGERQRIAFGRLIYHRPQFAVLDESTSAVTAEFEQSIYSYLSDSGFCSIISVTHRVKQLQQYHHFRLGFDGIGGVKFEKL